MLLGLGKPATGPYKHGTWAHNDKVKIYNYDPRRARELLEQAGWKDADADGILEKNGRPFEFEILTNQGNETRQKCAEIIQRQLKEVGIAVKIRIVEWSAFITHFINKRNFDAVILGWTIPLDPDAYDVWYSGKTAPEELISFPTTIPKRMRCSKRGAALLIRRRAKNTTTVFRKSWPRTSPTLFCMYLMS